jgi:ABC-type Mn2+/Zn2+ transport system ATPase subunit
LKYRKALKNINTEVLKNKFTIVIGDIGSGKSSFLQAILNEMVASK